MRKPLQFLFTVLISALLLVGCSTGSEKHELSDTNSPLTPNPTPFLTEWNGRCEAEPNKDGYYDPEGYRDAMICSIDLLEWPTSYRPDADLINTYVQLDPFWAESVYPAGHEKFSLTTGIAVCAWIMEWNDAHEDGDTTREQLALKYISMYALEPQEHIAGYPDGSQDEASKQSWEVIIQQAEVGDPSGLQAEITNACGYIPWPTPEAGQ